MKGDRDYRDDIAAVIDQKAGRTPEHEVAAKAVWARFEEDTQFAAALRKFMPKKAKAKKANSEEDDDA